jgi:tetratricopeptide (TPR) repeat protein
MVCVGCADVMTHSRQSEREGTKLYKQGEYADAAGAFRNSVRQKPGNYQGYYQLARCYEQMGQYQQAIAAYRSARHTIDMTIEGREDKQAHQDILNGLAGAIAKSDQRDIETDSVLRDAQARGTGEAWVLLAKVYAIRGDPDSAFDAYNRASLLAPKDFEIVKEYGLYLERMGQKQRAVAPLRRAYALNSTDEQVAQALRRVGVVPGPSIMEEEQLARPIIPKGPIPEWEIRRASPPPAPASPSSSVPNATVEAPKD